MVYIRILISCQKEIKSLLSQIFSFDFCFFFCLFYSKSVDLCHLHLITLDVSCNRIASLPVELRLMTELVSLELQSNPLTSPPASVSLYLFGVQMFIYYSRKMLILLVFPKCLFFYYCARVWCMCRCVSVCFRVCVCETKIEINQKNVSV